MCHHTVAYKITLMENRFLYYYFYSKLAYYKQQPLLVEKYDVTFVCAGR